MLAVTGLASTLVQELIKLLPEGEDTIRIPMDTSQLDAPLKLPKADRFVLAAGILPGKGVGEYSPQMVMQVTACNLWNPIRICEWLLMTRHDVRICLIGSDSARKGSYDRMYAATKAGLHAYVQFRTVKPPQQLVLVSPPIIRDSAMTQKRADLAEVIRSRVTCSAADVARVVHRLLYHFEAEQAPSNYIQSVPAS